MEKRRIIILSVLIICLTTVVFLILNSDFSKHKDDVGQSKTLEEVEPNTQQEEKTLEEVEPNTQQEETEADFDEPESESQSKKEESDTVVEFPDSSGQQETADSVNQENVKNPEEQKEPDKTNDSESSDEKDIWTGYY